MLDPGWISIVPDMEAIIISYKVHLPLEAIGHSVCVLSLNITILVALFLPLSELVIIGKHIIAHAILLDILYWHGHSSLVLPVHVPHVESHFLVHHVGGHALVVHVHVPHVGHLGAHV